MRGRTWLALAAAVMLTACSGDPEPTDPSATPTGSASPTRTPSPSEPTEEPSATETQQPARLDWQPVPGPVADLVTVSGAWSLALPENGAAATLDGPEPRTIRAPAGFRITDTFLDGGYAVVVAEHEQASKPSRATVVDLATGEQSVIDGRSEVPTTVGGSWALGSGLLVHATMQGGDYCLAVADLVTGRSRPGPCVPPRHGLTNVTVSAAGIAAMSFDDGRPSCRTLNRVEGTTLEPLAGVQDCRGWEAVVTETASVWGVVPQERRIESSEFFADSGSGPVELGPGTTGTLTWCGDAAYVVRDPQRASDPARLLRIDPTGSTEVVYESTGRGQAFLSAPRCGGTDLTLTAFTAPRDEQVTASLR